MCVHVKRLKVMGAAHTTHAPCSGRLAVAKKDHLIFNLPTFSQFKSIPKGEGILLWFGLNLLLIWVSWVEIRDFYTKACDFLHIAHIISRRSWRKERFTREKQHSSSDKAIHSCISWWKLLWGPIRVIHKKPHTSQTHLEETQEQLNWLPMPFTKPGKSKDKRRCLEN